MSYTNQELANAFADVAGLKQENSPEQSPEKAPPSKEIDNTNPDHDLEQEAQLEKETEQVSDNENDDDDEGQTQNQTHNPELDEMEFKIVVNGEEKVVKGIEQLKKGYMLQSDYTRKTQEFQAKAKQELETLSIQSNNTIYAANLGLQQAEQIVASVGGIEKLRAQLPAEQYEAFVEKYAYWSEQAEKVKPVIQAIEEAQAAQKQQDASEVFTYLCESIPGFGDKEANELVEWASKSVGEQNVAKLPITKEVWSMMHKAKLYDEGKRKLEDAKVSGKVKISANTKGTTSNDSTTQFMKDANKKIAAAKDTKTKNRTIEEQMAALLAR